MSHSIPLLQTRAFIVDAYRELNSKKLFWITMILSGLVVVSFAGLGLNETGFSIFGWDVPFPMLSSKVISKATFYKVAFSNFGIGFWLSWIATALALISTASLIPDFVSSGAIELTLSKPINRVRLFMTKYLVGLLFVALQVTVFTGLCFFVIGIRGGEWLPKIFLAVPIVVLFFSYLYCVSALVGLLTRSTIAALLITIVFWGALFLVNTTDAVFLQFMTSAQLRQEEYQKKIPRFEIAAARKLEIEALEAAGTEIATPPKGDPSKYTPEQLDKASATLASYRTKLREQEKMIDRWSFWSRLLVGVKTALPKTGETRQVLETALIDASELEGLRRKSGEELNTIDTGEEPDADIRIDRAEVQNRMEDTLRSRSTLWTLGTSFGFEVVVLGIACWIFSRRDF